MTEKEEGKKESTERAAIQVQTGDIDVAKVQLAARWAELSTTNPDLDHWLTAFGRAYKAIDETLRM